RAPRRAGLHHRRHRPAAPLHVVMHDAEQERKRRQRMRSLAIAWILAALVVLFFIVTIVRLGGHVADRPLGFSTGIMTDPANDKSRQQKRHGVVALACVGIVAAMVGLSFASVPLYRLFCQATGYGGVPQRAERTPGEVLDRTIRVRFDGNVDGALPWTFAPDQRVMDVKIGEVALAFFKATNNTSAPVSGTAVFNVAPELAGRYFTK